MEGYTFYNAKDDPFVLGGITHPDKNGGEYYRLDAKARDEFQPENKAVLELLSTHTSGATLRFKTDAKTIVLRAKFRNCEGARTHFAPTGSSGFDVFLGEGKNRRLSMGDMQFLTGPGDLNMPVKLSGCYEEVLINFPTYGGVELLEIGIPDGARLDAPGKRSMGPIGFYGSSITQGACTSRPSLCYTNFTCRLLDADCVNFGYSGSAKGEQEMARIIASRDMEIFVLDYDHNNSVEGLRATHYDFYKTIRNAHPEMPIIMMSRPYFTVKPTEDQIERQNIIKATLSRALSEGDKKIYFLSGDDFFPKDHPDIYSVDCVHPNDLGHNRMALALVRTIKEILK